MRELLQLFGVLFLWGLFTTVATLTLTAVFALGWIPLAKWILRWS